MKSPSNLKDSTSSVTEDLAVSRSQELVDLIIQFNPKQPLADFTTWFEELTKLNQTHPESQEIQELLAKASLQTIHLFGERKSFADMLNILDIFEQLTKQPDRSEIIVEYYAESLAIAVTYLRGSWDVEGTSKLLNRIHNLTKVNPDNKRVLLSYARSYVGAINRFCSNEHVLFCDRLLFEIRMFATKYPDDEDIQAEYAQALVYLIGAYARELRLQDLQQANDTIRKIVTRFPENKRIQMLVTRARILSNLALPKKG